MRLNIITATTTTKAINKATVIGKLSLVATAKINLLRQSILFANDLITLGKEEYKDKYELLVNKLNNLINSCPNIICNIRQVGCTSHEFENGFNIDIVNPFNPIPPVKDIIEPPIEENLPPEVGDNTIIVDNNITTTLTLSMFTADTIGPYTDPENDPIDAIRIDKIHSTNKGIFYVDGVEITKGQIITREQLIAGNLTHVGANIDTIASDSFDFSGRDEGSGIWVQ